MQRAFDQWDVYMDEWKYLFVCDILFVKIAKEKRHVIWY